MAVADRFGARIRLAGQDIDEKAARIAAFNLSESSHRAPYEVHAGNLFTDSQLAAYLGKAAAVVLCDSLFDRPDWPAAELTTDRLVEFADDGAANWPGDPATRIRAMTVTVAAMTTAGLACSLLSGVHIRAALVRTGVLRAVIALPRAWVRCLDPSACGCPGGAPDRAPVQMIDLSGLVTRLTCHLSSAPGSSLSTAATRSFPGGRAARPP